MTPADRLHAITRDFGAPFGFERSIKLRHESVSTNRFLLTVARDDLGPDGAQRIMDACRQLQMPDGCLAHAAQLLPDANVIHFGFEEELEGRAFYKIYLERQQAFTRAMSEEGRGAEPFVLHHAFKWNAADRREHVVARYICYPRLPRPAMLQRIASIYAGRQERTPWHLLCELVTAASRRVPGEEIMYLDVSEDGTERRSFDVNVYRAGFAVNSIARFFDPLATHFRLHPDAVSEALAPVLDRQLGHLAGGVDRHGRDFFTVYFGAEPGHFGVEARA